jgi:hypothetical protein
MGQIVVAGPSNSVVIDKQGMYWMAGKVSYLRLCGNGPNLNCRHSGRTQEMVNPRFQNAFFGRLIIDPRFFWFTVHPLPGDPGYYVGF